MILPDTVNPVIQIGVAMKGIKLVETQGTPEDVIVPLVNRVGQVAAARELKIAPATLNRWLKDNNYAKVILYVKKAEQPA